MKMKMKTSKPFCARPDNYILPIWKSCESMRSFAGREASTRERLDPNPVEKEENRSEHTKLLRRSQAACAAGACRKRFVFTTRARKRPHENLCEARDRS